MKETELATAAVQHESTAVSKGKAVGRLCDLPAEI